ncbi:hypothetical protein BDFG_06694, partial [Blastomyces dermatitidis ATCC 26199]
EEFRESLVSETVTLRSSICSFSSTACLSSAQTVTKLSLQNSAVSLSSLCEKASVQSLISITTYLHCIKQLKKRGILYIYLFFHSHCFCYICNNNFCLSV